MQAAVSAPATLVASGRRPLRWAALLALAVALAVAIGALRDRWKAREAALDPAALVAGYGPPHFSAAWKRADQGVSSARRHLALGPDEWLRQEGLARALIARHRLNGDYADLAEAERLLVVAMGAAPDPAGPVLTRAQLALTLHRLPLAETALVRASRWGVPTLDEKADALALGGDIAQQRGRPHEAMRAYAGAARIAPSQGIDLRRAMLIARTGERAEARRELEAMLAHPRQQPATLAELMLLRANLAYAEGDWAGAATWIDAANRVFPGYWLAEAYAAQQQALAGRPAVAIRAYRALATRTGRPEVMDALAHLLRLEGHGAASREWAERAAAGWRERQALFPEAVAAHVAEHELAVGSVVRALALANQDVAARPHGPSIALLARALILSGHPRQALAWLDRAERQGWVSAGNLMLRAEANAALGNREASEAARARAEAINPRAADPKARLIWFGHD